MRWSEIEIEIIKNNKIKDDLLNLIPNRNWDSIRKKRKKIAPDLVKECKKWTQKEIDIIIENYENLNKNKLMELLPGRSWDSIKLKSKSIGISRSNDFFRYSNMSVLLKDESQSFYWVGFILADGHINNKERIKVEISIKDVEHLKKFKNYIETDKISINDKNCRLLFQNKEICPKLCDKFDILSNKTYNPPNFSLYNFNKELIFSLIIGFIDGDGNINKLQKRNDCNLRIRLHKSWLSNLIFMENFLYQYFGIEKNNILSKIGNDGYSTLTISNNILLKKIKNECISLDIPIMKRKWDKIDENRLTRYEKSLKIKQDIIDLKISGFKNIFIIKKLNISKKTFYKYISELNCI